MPAATAATAVRCGIAAGVVKGTDEYWLVLLTAIHDNLIRSVLKVELAAEIGCVEDCSGRLIGHGSVSYMPLRAMKGMGHKVCAPAIICSGQALASGKC